ncbi:MAG: L-fucose isomerase [Akkermansia sp.]|nr:L-fucose isomerase [Akkermansia sp.]
MKYDTLPTIGIRPTIDGRRLGVRESLEDQTMNMAKAAAALIEANVKHANGQPVKCIIADTTIGGPAEAAACNQKFAENNVGCSLIVTPCWCYITETFETDATTPKAIWGFNGTERPGAVYLAAALAGYAQKGIPAFSIYGHDVQDADDTSIPEDVAEKILRFARAGLTVATLRGKGYLSIGGCSMGIAGSIVDQSFWESYMGMRVQAVDMTEVRRRMELGIYDKAEFDLAMEWAKKYVKIGPDRNRPDLILSPEEKERTLRESILMTIIFRDMMHGNAKLKEINCEEESMGFNAICGGFQGQRHWTDFYPNGDMAESILNSTFDWNGPREAVPFATENDAMNGVCMLLLHQLTGRAACFSDIRTYWSPDAVKRVTGYTMEGLAKDGIMHLINSGSTALDGNMHSTAEDGTPIMKKTGETTQADIEAMMGASEWCPANREYFRGGGYSLHFVSKGNVPVTMIRMNLVKGQGPVLTIVEGWTCDLPQDVNDKLDQRTDPGWPTTWFAPRLTGKGGFKDVYTVMANMGANHGAWTYGHIGADIITVASMLRIPVYAHNVPEDKVYRPAAWDLFGTACPESADFRACANFGPIYGKY